MPIWLSVVKNRDMWFTLTLQQFLKAFFSDPYKILISSIYYARDHMTLSLRA